MINRVYKYHFNKYIHHVQFKMTQYNIKKTHCQIKFNNRSPWKKWKLTWNKRKINYFHNQHSTQQKHILKKGDIKSALRLDRAPPMPPFVRDNRIRLSSVLRPGGGQSHPIRTGKIRDAWRQCRRPTSAAHPPKEASLPAVGLFWKHPTSGLLLGCYRGWVVWIVRFDYEKFLVDGCCSFGTYCVFFLFEFVFVLDVDFFLEKYFIITYLYIRSIDIYVFYDTFAYYYSRILIIN